MNKFTRLSIPLLIIMFILPSLKAQIQEAKLESTLKEYHSIPKEVAYLHLNKTILLMGEQLGFSAYVVNKNDLKPSIETTNLYVQISNSAGEVVKEKMLLVKNGVASNTIQIDTSFTSGDYVLTGFTNWMRNFDEQNFFKGSFVVRDSNLDFKVNKDDLTEIDAQFLPESGHLLSDVTNTVGVVVKDKTGYGLPNAAVQIRDSRNRLLSDVALNRYGIGKFTLIPDPNEKYSAIVVFEGKEISVSFQTPVASEGIILSAVQRNKELRLVVNSNSASLPKIENKPYFLIIQNRKRIETIDIKFGDKKSIPVVLDLDYLASGMNIITLMDEACRPIAERLFFNYEGIPLREIQDPRLIEAQDSLAVRFLRNGADSSHLSVSILPQNSISNNSNHNIVSYTMLQPYLRGNIENGSWYFHEITEEKKYALDNLLITQGWSSYDWGAIFEKPLELKYRFENNIELTGYINKGSNRNRLRYLVHANSNNEPLFLDIPPGNGAFVFDGFRPLEGEELVISRIKDNDKLLPAGLAVQFSPQKIPYLSHHSKFLLQKNSEYSINGNLMTPVLPFEGQAEELKEVLLEIKIDKLLERERKLGIHSFGRIHVIKENEVPLYQTLAGYLKSKGLMVSEAGGSFSVNNKFAVAANESGSGASFGKPAPSKGMAVFLDGIRIVDQTMFHQYPLSSIDYIEINKHGLGEGITGGNGAIKIYSLLKSGTPARDRNRVQQFEIPLAYSSPKLFYVPRYENNHDEFFQKYGVIDWKPDLYAGVGEDVIFKIKKPEVDFQMIIEGFTTDGKLIYDVKTVSVGE